MILKIDVFKRHLSDMLKIAPTCYLIDSYLEQIIAICYDNSGNKLIKNNQLPVILYRN